MGAMNTVVHVANGGLEGHVAPTITSFESELYRIPLAESLSDAGHGVHTHFEIITCRIVCQDGLEGIGYTYTGGRGGTAIRALLRDEIGPLLVGQKADCIEELWTRQRRACHYLGLGGLAGFAIAAADIALWDIRCKRLGLPLWQVAGGHASQVACYRGLIDLAYSDDYLLEVVEREMGSGHNGIKLKVGRSDIERDVYRVRSVRELIGGSKSLMVDANYSWNTHDAIAFARGVEDQSITWFEEPVAHDDLRAYAAVAEATAIPIASGENWRTLAEFQHGIECGKVAFLQPDASNVSGISGWLQIAELAETSGLPIASHGMHELHVSLMAARPNAAMLEVHSFPIDHYTKTPLLIADGIAFAPQQAGIGVEFDKPLLTPHRVD